MKFCMTKKHPDTHEKVISGNSRRSCCTYNKEAPVKTGALGRDKQQISILFFNQFLSKVCVVSFELNHINTRGQLLEVDSCTTGSFL